MSRPNHNQHNLPEGSANLYSCHQSNGDLVAYDYGDSGPERGIIVLLDELDSHGSLEPPPQTGGADLGSRLETSHTSFTNLSNTDGNSLAQEPRWANCQMYPSHLPRSLHACNTCGIKCKRQSDLDRHLKTARKHSVPGGPVCPETRCKYRARFTRVDNFKAHYKKQHGKSDDETDEFIQEWKARGRA
ncbi:hypothetical protein C7212DRAFT_278372 [Tuber magnatum]|uniref:C2H2-type domain-containing protein n=1 Tax=Tuber magnatum TaxID=42249 RepID=A0A317STH7_9PEZI|nr:hypothetical protein C7212DRAFT_278372 [Tuber magnatum]